MIVLPALFTLALAASPAVRAQPEWLVGTWIWASEGGAPDYSECSGPLAIRYAAGGRYSLTAEEGRWRVDGNRLTETAARVDRNAWGNAAPPVGVPQVSRIRRLTRDSFRKEYRRGSPAIFYRCPGVSE